MAANRKKDDQEKKEQDQQQNSRSRQSGRGRGGQQSQRSRNQGSNGAEGRQESRGREARRLEEPKELEPTEVFEPVSAARVATLRLARNWRLGGNTYAAMHAYERILAKYGGTPAANSAAEELIAMAGDLEREGKFYTALNIYNKVEEYFNPYLGGDVHDPRRVANRRPRGRRVS